MSGPFTDATSNEIFIENRCARCVHADINGDPCDDFTPAFIGEWPRIIVRSRHSPVHVDCTKYEERS
jgi:hypothetical protein